GRGIDPKRLCFGCQRDRFVSVALSLGAFRCLALGCQNPHPTGGTLAFARANAGQSGYFSGGSLAGSIVLRTRSLLFDGSRLCRLAAALRHRTVACLVRGARQKVLAVLSFAFPSSRRQHRLAKRSNYQLASFLCCQEIPRQTAPSPPVRRRARAGIGLFDQSLWFAGPSGRPTLPAALAGRIVFSLAQAAPAGQSLLRDQRQRRPHTVVGGGLGICSGGHSQKATRQPSNPLPNSPNLERERVRENALARALSSTFFSE